ncbi:hypothetical protein LguiA_030411 [Lonicera macranthoides]
MSRYKKRPDRWTRWSLWWAQQQQQSWSRENGVSKVEPMVGTTTTRKKYETVSLTEV